MFEVSKVKRFLSNVLVATIVSGLLITGISCGDGTPADDSWDSPDEFVLYDVNRYIDITLENNRGLLEIEYGEELARLGMWVWDSYVHSGQEPVVGEDIERFEDTCWVPVSDIIVARQKASTAVATYYYTFYNDRWQLDRIVARFFDIDGLEWPELELVFYGELE